MTLEQRIQFSLCLPVFNEMDAVVACVSDAIDVLGSRFDRFEIVVVDDGSRDLTPRRLVENFGHDCRVVVVTHSQNLGYGAAVTTGLQTSKGETVMLMDGDGQFQIRDLDPFLAALEFADVVIGYRACRADSRHRRFLGKLWTRLMQGYLGIEARDVDCGYKLFRRKVIQKLKLRSNGACISPEILIQCQLSGFKIAELPIDHYPRNTGQSTGASPRVVLRALLELPRLAAFRLGVNRV